MRSPDPAAANNLLWRNRCDQVFCDLRAYLMGQGLIKEPSETG
jgi:hypothetical protein